jgi:hypothetical protein
MKQRVTHLSAITAFYLLVAVVSASNAPKKIIGSTKPEVDALLHGWPSTLSTSRSTATKQFYYYVKDVEIIVAFTDAKAVGVAVIDKPGVGISPIPQQRFKELVALIGGGEPKPEDILRDDKGIREFSVGDAD